MITDREVVAIIDGIRIKAEYPNMTDGIDSRIGRLLHNSETNQLCFGLKGAREGILALTVTDKGTFANVHLRVVTGIEAEEPMSLTKVKNLSLGLSKAIMTLNRIPNKKLANGEKTYDIIPKLERIFHRNGHGIISDTPVNEL